MPSIRVKNVAMCDDIRFEIGNKHTLVGVYSGDVVLSKIPSELTISFYIELKAPEQRTYDIEFEVKLGDEVKQHVVGLLDIDRPHQLGVIAFPRMPMHVGKATTISLRAKFEGEPWRPLIRRRVRQGRVGAVLPSPLGATD
jgi:hypothetical protein